MGLLFFLLALLFVPYSLWRWKGVSPAVSGCRSAAVLFTLTGAAHFLKTSAMVPFLPPWIPERILVIQITGVLELVGALGLLLPPYSRITGLALILFLVAVFPANVYGAMQRVPWGGHELGGLYLVLRTPIQLFLIGWLYWFAVRRSGPPRNRPQL
jgi:uncharacterized membrane protein